MFTFPPTIISKTVPSFAGTTWNPSDKSSSVTLSNGNLTATASGTSDSGVRGVSAKNAGKYYFEYAVASTTIAGGDTGVGIANTSPALSSFGAAAAEAVMIFRTGNVWAGGANRFGMSGVVLTLGNVVRVAVDFDNRRIWFAVSGGNWNGNATNDPTVTSTGYNFASAISGTSIAPIAAFNANNDAFTANFGASAFAYPVPAGFTAGWPA